MELPPYRAGSGPKASAVPLLLLLVFTALAAFAPAAAAQGQQWTGTTTISATSSQSGVSFSLQGQGQFSFSVDSSDQLSGSGTMGVVETISLQYCNPLTIDLTENSVLSGTVQGSVAHVHDEQTWSGQSTAVLTCTSGGQSFSSPIPPIVPTSGGTNYDLQLTSGYSYTQSFPSPLNGEIAYKLSSQTQNGSICSSQWGSICDKSKYTLRFNPIDVFPTGQQCLNNCIIYDNMSANINVQACYPDIPFDSPISITSSLAVTVGETPPSGSPSVIGPDTTLSTPQSECSLGGQTATSISANSPTGTLAIGEWTFTLSGTMTVDTGLYAHQTPYTDGNYYSGSTFDVPASNSPLHIFVLSSDSKQIQIPVTLANGQTSSITGTGDMTVGQTGLAISTSNGEYRLNFTVTGQSGTTGSEVISVPPDDVPGGYVPTVYVNGQRAAVQSYTVDPTSGAYVIYFQTHFSTDQVQIVFATSTPNPSPDITSVILGLLLIAFLLAIIVGGALRLHHRSQRKKGKQALQQPPSQALRAPQQQMFCPVCSSPVAPGEAYCRKCGAKLEGGKLCQSCGFSNPKANAFCANCGKKL